MNELNEIKTNDHIGDIDHDMCIPYYKELVE